MILKSFEYYELLNDDRYWGIKPFELGRINLFVAKNATGKTRTLTTIQLLSMMIKDNIFNDNANYDVGFIDDLENYFYHLHNDEKKQFLKYLYVITQLFYNVIPQVWVKYLPHNWIEIWNFKYCRIN